MLCIKRRGREPTPGQGIRRKIPGWEALATNVKTLGELRSGSQAEPIASPAGATGADCLAMNAKAPARDKGEGALQRPGGYRGVGKALSIKPVAHANVVSYSYF